MTIELIQAIVRQTTVLIAQLATSKGGGRRLAHLADQVFQNLVTELERQGVSRLRLVSSHPEYQEPERKHEARLFGSLCG